MTALRAVTLESTELVEAGGVGAEHDLGRLPGAEAEPTLIKIHFSNTAKLGQLPHKWHLPQFGSRAAVDGVLQPPGPLVVP